MGILIEQYRSRIGSHDNFVKTKDTLSHWKNHFLSLMFMMVFYNAYIPLLIRQANDVEENPTIFDVISIEGRFDRNEESVRSKSK